MKKLIVSFTFFAFLATLLFPSCKKDKNDNDGKTWNLNVSVNLDGEFTVIATATFSIDGDNFSAAITTSQIGGASEVHNFTINGTVSGDVYTVTNSSFSINSGGGTENVTVTSGTHTISGSTMTGSGTISVIPAGLSTPIPGTYTLTATS